MKAALSALLWLVAAQPVAAQDSLQELLEAVRDSAARTGAGIEARLAQFREGPARQQEMLEALRRELAAAQTRNDELTARVEANERELDARARAIDARMADMQPVFALVRESAGELSGLLAGSQTSAQLGPRNDMLDRIAATDHVPNRDELHRWHVLMLEEIAQSGRVVRFDTRIVAETGEPLEAEVVRAGTFNLVSGDRFLRYDSATDTIQALPRQPARRFRAAAAALSAARAEVTTMAVDPSQGALLGLLLQTPGLRERIEQGGAIGLVIVALGTFGLAIGLYRLIYLGAAGGRIRRQLVNPRPSGDNALGRVLRVYSDHAGTDVETLELRLDEAIMKETPRLEKWQAAIKVVAAVAPLLGLLGTVVGMIETFQSITLFGTGDPRLMADGISKALVTTMLGLIVAIPLVLLHSLVAGRSKALIEILEQQSAGIVAAHAEKRV